MAVAAPAAERARPRRVFGDIDRLRLIAQGAIATAVLGGATYLAAEGVISEPSIVALFSAALGAVGAGAVGGSRGGSQRGDDRDRNGRREP